MPPRVHLVTVVGLCIKMLPHMLRHYQRIGLDSTFVNVHLRSPDDPVLENVKQVTDAFGCGIASKTIGDWQRNLRRMYAEQRQSMPNDWFVLADQDELQSYPGGLLEAIEYCERKGYDYIRGIIIDRVSADGSFPEVRADTDLACQFPLGGFISYPLLGGDPRKIVASKGRIPLAKGQHCALTGQGCPVRDILIPVHHFKWTHGLEERLKKRMVELKDCGIPHWIESERFLSYYRAHGHRIEIEDPRFHIAPCNPEYGNWNVICDMALVYSRNMPW
jgi:hypothetical protein